MYICICMCVWIQIRFSWYPRKRKNNNWELGIRWPAGKSNSFSSMTSPEKNRGQSQIQKIIIQLKDGYIMLHLIHLNFPSFMFKIVVALAIPSLAIPCHLPRCCRCWWTCWESPTRGRSVARPMRRKSPSIGYPPASCQRCFGGWPTSTSTWNGGARSKWLDVRLRNKGILLKHEVAPCKLT